MSVIGLVVKQARLAEMEAALTRAHDDIVAAVEGALGAVDQRIDGWDPGTISRAAQIDHQQRLRQGVERLTQALLDVRAQLAAVATKAHEVEVENVALCD